MKKVICSVLSLVMSSTIYAANNNDIDDDLLFLPTNPSGKQEQKQEKVNIHEVMEFNNSNQPTIASENVQTTPELNTTPKTDVVNTPNPEQKPRQATNQTTNVKPYSSPYNANNSRNNHGTNKNSNNYAYIAKLPVKEIYVIQKTPRSPKMYFADSQGRYLIYNGDLYDMWDNKRKLDTKTAIEYSFTHLPLDILKKFQGLNEIISMPKERSMIKGREIYLFIDPTEESSIKLLENLYNDRNFISYYTHIIIMNNTNTPLTSEFIKKLSCSDATTKERIEAIINRDSDILEKTQTVCNISNIDEKLKNNEKFAKFINIQNLPFLIAPSGKYTDGALNEPYKFIQGIK